MEPWGVLQHGFFIFPITAAVQRAGGLQWTEKVHVWVEKGMDWFRTIRPE